MTIRRDLQALAEQGKVIRTHGGATMAERVSFEFEFLHGSREHQAAKEAIAVAAAAQVKDGESVLLDSGTTTLELAKRLRGKAATDRRHHVSAHRRAIAVRPAHRGVAAGRLRAAVVARPGRRDDGSEPGNSAGRRGVSRRRTASISRGVVYQDSPEAGPHGGQDGGLGRRGCSSSPTARSWARRPCAASAGLQGLGRR